MYSTKTQELEKQINELFGNHALLAITNAFIGDKGYMVRIEAYGLPFTIDSYGKDNKTTEELAIDEFKKQLTIAKEELLFPSQPEEKYEEFRLTEEDINKLYKFVDYPDSPVYDHPKSKTVAKMCELPNGKYECVIKSPYMNLNVRSTAWTKKLALASAIWKSREVFSPRPIRVGKLPYREDCVDPSRTA